MAFEELRKKYLPTVDPDNTIAFAGYGQVASMAEILRRCGDDLTRANVLKQPHAGGFPLALLPRRHQFQLHPRGLHADEDALHLAVQRQGLGYLGQAGDGVVLLPSPPLRGRRGTPRLSRHCCSHRDDRSIALPQQKTPAARPGFSFSESAPRSVLRNHRGVEVVVQPGAEDVLLNPGASAVMVAAPTIGIEREPEDEPRST